MSDEKINQEKQIKKEFPRLKNELKTKQIQNKLDDKYTDYNKLFNDLYGLSLEIKIPSIAEKIISLMKACDALMGSSPERVLKIETVAGHSEKPKKKISDNELYDNFIKTAGEINQIFLKKSDEFMLIACFAINRCLETAGSHLNQVIKVKKLKPILTQISNSIIEALLLEPRELIANFMEDNITQTLQDALKWVKNIIAREEDVKLLFGEKVAVAIRKHEVYLESLIKINKVTTMEITAEVLADEEIYILLKNFLNIEFSFWENNADVVLVYFQRIKIVMALTKFSNIEAYQKTNNIFLSALELYKNYCSTIKAVSDDRSDNSSRLWLLALYVIISGKQSYIALSPELKDALREQVTSNTEEFPAAINFYFEAHLSTLAFVENFDKLELHDKSIQIENLIEKLVGIAEIKEHSDIKVFIEENLPQFYDLCLKKIGAFSFGELRNNYCLHYLINLLRLACVINEVIEANDTQMITDFFDENADMAYGNAYLIIPALLSFFSTQNLSKEKLDVIVEKISLRVKKDWNFLLNQIAIKNTDQIFAEVTQMLSVINKERNLNQIRAVFGNDFAEILSNHFSEIQVLNALNEFIQCEFAINDKYGVKFQAVLEAAGETLKQKPDSQHHACLYFLYLVMKGPAACQSQLQDMMAVLKKNLLAAEDKIFKNIQEYVDLYLTTLDYCLHENEKTYTPTIKSQRLKQIFEKIALLKAKKTDINFKYLINHGITGLLNYCQSKTDASSSLSASSTAEDPLEKLENIFQYKDKLIKGENREQLKSRIELRMTHAIVYFRMCQLNPEVIEYNQSYQAAFQEVYNYIFENASEVEAIDPVYWVAEIQKIAPPDAGSSQYSDLIFILGKHHEEKKNYEIALKFYNHYKYNILDKKPFSDLHKGMYHITREIYWARVQLCQSQMTNPAALQGTLFNPVGQTNRPSTPAVQELYPQVNQNNDSRIPAPGGL